MKHPLVYSEQYKDLNGNPKLRGVKIPPNLLTSGYEWREIKSARVIEQDFSKEHIFRKFRLRLTRNISLILFDSRCLPAGFGPGGMVFGKETTMIRLTKVQVVDGKKFYNNIELFDGTKEGVVKIFPDPSKIWPFVTKAHPIKKSELSKVRVVSKG